MSAAHTPGPWFAHGRYIGTKNHKSFIGECRDVNGNWTDEGMASANARLIAAAPDLLAELKSLRFAYVGLMQAGRNRILDFGGDCDPVDVMEAGDPALRSADAVIAKATA